METMSHVQVTISHIDGTPARTWELTDVTDVIRQVWGIQAAPGDIAPVVTNHGTWTIPVPRDLWDAAADQTVATVVDGGEAVITIDRP